MQIIIKIIISIILLATSYPIANILAKNTKDEKSIYNKYFNLMLWPLAILAAIFYSLNIPIALTLTFITLVMFFWRKK